MSHKFCKWRLLKSCLGTTDYVHGYEVSEIYFFSLFPTPHPTPPTPSPSCLFKDYFLFYFHLQIEDARKKVSEKSTNMHNQILDAHENSKSLEKEFKALTKNIQSLQKDRELVEKKRNEALRVRAETELDLKDLEERISNDAGAKVCLWWYLSIHNNLIS